MLASSAQAMVRWNNLSALVAKRSESSVRSSAMISECRSGCFQAGSLAFFGVSLLINIQLDRLAKF